MGLIQGTALQFDGATQFCKTAVASVATNNFTYSCWALRTASGGGVCLSNGIDDGVANFNGMSISFPGSGSAFSITANGVAAIPCNTVPATGTWYNVAIIRNSGVIKFYVNGVDDGISDSTHTPSTPTGFTTIGSTANLSGNMVTIGNKPFPGSVDDIRIYDRAISPTELATLVSRASNPALADISSTSLKLWWKLDDGSGSSATDSSGNAKTGTLTNTPLWVTGIVATGISAAAPTLSLLGVG